MGFVPVMWAVWGISVLSMIVVTIYGARLGRNEEDQLFLSDSSSAEKSEQDAIAARVGKLQPLKRAVLTLAGGMTVIVLAYYILDAVRQFK